MLSRGFLGIALTMWASPNSVSVFAAVAAPLKVERAAPDDGSHAQRFHICPLDSPVSKTSGWGIFAVEEELSISLAPFKFSEMENPLSTAGGTLSDFVFYLVSRWSSVVPNFFWVKIHDLFWNLGIKFKFLNGVSKILSSIVGTCQEVPEPGNNGYWQPGGQQPQACMVIGRLVDIPEKISESANHHAGMQLFGPQLPVTIISCV